MSPLGPAAVRNNAFESDPMPEKPSIIQSEDVILKAEDRDDADPTYLPQNILLTGGCGFIGSHVCKYLVGCKSRNRLDSSGRAIEKCALLPFR